MKRNKEPYKHRITIRFGTVAIALTLVFALAASPAADASDCGNAFVPGQTALTDLGSSSYQGAQGGLYPGGSNEVPADHEALGQDLASHITPVDATGAPAPDGKIVLVSIGVSNTKTEFESFISTVASNPAVNPQLVPVNGSIGGAPVTSWLSPTSKAWDVVERQLDEAGVTVAQVQAAWVMLPEKDPSEPFPVDADTYRDDLSLVLQSMKTRLPNVRTVYVSSRIYGGYGRQLSPEPWAYQHGFGVKWTIEDQIDGVPGLNPNPTMGAVKAPWIAWGPYLWANGLGSDRVEGGAPGRSDGLEWVCSDFLTDGIHPSSSGATKVATMLLNHFVTDPTTCIWFLDEQAREESGCRNESESPTTMHVASMSLGLASQGTRARASIQVVDNEDVPLAAVTVTGDWFRNGALLQAGDTGVTADDGRAVISSDTAFTAGDRTIITFCVTDLDLEPTVYDPAQNAQDCAQVRSP